MSRKQDERPPIGVDQNIIDATMEEVMHASMIPYAEHVIMERAVPRVEDGLKPVQRRILFTMNELAITPDTPHRKCARIVGDCLGKYHPHGDSSVYEALVRMAQDFSMREKLVDGHGNFGSVDGDGAAAMRYTEARMAPLAMEMLRDLDKDTVPFRLNFDDTLKEPDMLPAAFPNLLVNGASGIAVGLATNIPPHNLGETIQAVIAEIDQPDIPLDELMQLLPAPDFPTGGILLDNSEIRAAYETGKGKLTLRAATHIENGPAGRKLIVITEIPYQVNKAAMLERILHLSEEKKAALGCIYDIRDESDRTGLRAVIELKKDANPDKVLSYLFKYSDMQITFGVNMVAIADGKPRLLSIKQALDYYIRHRKAVVTARTAYDLNKAKARAHVLEGLMIAVDNLDEVIRLIRQSESPKTAKAALMTAFSLTDVQAQAILDIRLQRLTHLEIEALRKEYAELLKLIAELESILASEKKLLSVIKKELKAVAAKYGTPRRTLLAKPEDVVEAIQKDEIIPEDVIITYTAAGLLRRTAVRRTQTESQTEEEVRYRFETQTDHQLLFFTNYGNCYSLPILSLQDNPKARDKGVLLSTILPGLADDEEPIMLLCPGREASPAQKELLLVTRLGRVKRAEFPEYSTRRSKFVMLTLQPGDRLCGVLPLNPDADILLIARSGMSIRFNVAEVPLQGRTAGGVRGIALEEGDEILWSGQPLPDDTLVLMTERGFSKRLLPLDFDCQGRGGKGVRSFYYNRTGSNGTHLVAVVCTEEADISLRVLQKSSPATILPMASIPAQPKTGKGAPVVMALLDDLVLDIVPVPTSSNPLT